MSKISLTKRGKLLFLITRCASKRQAKFSFRRKTGSSVDLSFNFASFSTTSKRRDPSSLPSRTLTNRIQNKNNIDDAVRSVQVQRPGYGGLYVPQGDLGAESGQSSAQWALARRRRLHDKRSASDVELRVVTAAEASGTTSKVWDYGMVVGYAWEEMFKTGVLQVTFLKETCEIPYNEDELQDLGLETYALRPLSCEIQLIMRSIHNSVHDHFNAADQPARRSSATILRKVGMLSWMRDKFFMVYNVGGT
ncbi:hypothetical protein GQ600_5760 [Phytophthora cactorum]|nr:hypothetical protein GQ600_5760 [Phytophthora cactorum]